MPSFDRTAPVIPVAVIATAPRPCLVVTSFATTVELGRIVLLNKASLTVGRGRECDVAFDESTISRVHVRFDCAGDVVRVTDLNTRNGTFVNGQRIESVVLHEGDRVQLGRTTLRYALSDRGHEQDLSIRRAVAVSGIGTWSFRAPDLLDLVETVPGRLLHGGLTGWQAILEADRAALRAALTSPARPTIDLECRLASPQERWVSLRGELFNDASSTQLAGIVVDITAHKRLEQQLRVQARMFEALSDAIVVFDPEGRVLEWAGSAEATFGLRRDEVRGASLDELLGAPDQPPHFSAVGAAVRDRGEWAGELRLAAKAGTRLFDVRALPFSISGDERAFTLLVCRDVSERRELEARLALSERVASLGTLAAGFGHEINNPLTYVIGNLRLIADEVRPADPEVALAIQDALEGAERIAALVRDLKTLSQNSTRRAPIDVKKAIEFALRVTSKEISFRTRVQLELGEVPPVVATEGTLAQVFINLLVNAAQAIPDGAKERNLVTVRCAAEGGQCVVEISDTGRGMAPGVKARIFDPFFTTRAGAGGTGLGLSLVHRIVTDAGGSITCDSAIGVGSRFRIVLPGLADTSAELASVTPVPQALQVLCVDDESAVLRTLRRLLRPHSVVAAGSAPEALDILDASTSFDVILCDLMMPGMSGIEFFKTLAQRQPALTRRVVFMTGGAFSEESRTFVSDRRVRLLEKPFDATALEKLLRERPV